uniref:Disintegrin and metalloproteinase domain-containing protein 1a-like n=1 Tax=Phascolarctos cinereus TaxID=38626 RepID=A0A6P5JNT8_PHACI|nr:disintegrin and metalloproteinase domain-containing protein 1a-like [Phascolarctos cinereus]
MSLRGPGSRSHLKGKQDVADMDERERELQRASMDYIWSHTKYVKTYIVVDKKRFEMWDENVTKTTEKVMDVVSQLDTFTHEFNTRVVLIGLEIWTEGNLIHISLNIRFALMAFNRWRTDYVFRRVIHDIAHLIVGHNTGSAMGDAYFRGTCTYYKAATIDSFYHEDITRFTNLLAHELGHTLGMMHDHSGCRCGEQSSCIMNDAVTHESRYSNCSIDNYYEYLRTRGGICLYEKPDPSRIMRKSVCGNRVLDRGEECDCGSVETCSKDPCCLPTCKMTKGSVCAFGPCCEGCQFRLRGQCLPSQ